MSYDNIRMMSHDMLDDACDVIYQFKINSNSTHDIIVGIYNLHSHTHMRPVCVFQNSTILFCQNAMLPFSHTTIYSLTVTLPYTP